jgi:hypothetical protein
MFEHAAKLNFEGIVSKKADAPYRSERTEAWVKIKTIQKGKFPVIGFVKDPTGVAALYLGKPGIGPSVCDRILRVMPFGGGAPCAEASLAMKPANPQIAHEATPAKSRRVSMISSHHCPGHQRPDKRTMPRCIFVAVCLVRADTPKFLSGNRGAANSSVGPRY